MENLKLPRWPDEASKVFGGGGLLDGLPAPVRSSGLDFLLGGADGQGGLTIGQVDPGALVLGRPEGNYLPATGPKNPIGPVVGYPETGKNSWRAGNDDVIVAAVNNYNNANRYLPGDAEYMTPKLAKVWMMRESGGSPDAFKTDPFQVNTPGDWVTEKGRIAGLTKGQAMTPLTSAEAALKWARYKSTWPGLEFSSPLARRAHYGTYEALLNYNGNKQSVDGIPFRVRYANDILNRAWASYGDWQE
jgi:hypothetical protein